MYRFWRAVVLGTVAALTLGVGELQAQQYYFNPDPTQAYQLQRYYYWPYHYYPHNYWPVTSPRWPEPEGHPYRRPPAYQAYPPFLEQGWRYELWQPMPYYQGFHFWLDQF